MTKLGSGYVVMGDHQLWEGYTVFIAKTHVEHLEDLPRDVRRSYLDELVDVGKAVREAFRATRVNYEILMNQESHLHAHIYPRFGTHDPGDRQRPVWSVAKEVRENAKTLPSPAKLDALVRRLKVEIGVL